MNLGRKRDSFSLSITVFPLPFVPSSHAPVKQPYAAKSNLHFPNHKTRSTQLIRRLLNIKDRPRLLSSESIVLQHPTIHPRVLALELEHGLRGHGLEDEMVVAVGTVFIALFEFLGIFSEDLLAFFAGECLWFFVRGVRVEGG